MKIFGRNNRRREKILKIADTVRSLKLSVAGAFFVENAINYLWNSPNGERYVQKGMASRLVTQEGLAELYKLFTFFFTPGVPGPDPCRRFQRGLSRLAMDYRGDRTILEWGIDVGADTQVCLDEAIKRYKKNNFGSVVFETEDYDGFHSRNRE